MLSKTHTSFKNSSRPTIGLLIVGIFPPNEQLLWSGVVDAARQYDVNLISFCGSYVHHPDPVVASYGVPPVRRHRALARRGAVCR